MVEPKIYSEWQIVSPKQLNIGDKIALLRHPEDPAPRFAEVIGKPITNKFVPGSTFVPLKETIMGNDLPTKRSLADWGVVPNKISGYLKHIARIDGRTSRVKHPGEYWEETFENGGDVDPHRKNPLIEALRNQAGN